MIACCRWVLSTPSMGCGESANTAWYRQAVNSSPCPAGTCSLLRRLTRRTISRAVTWSHLRREVNAVKPISATSASEIQH